MKHTTCSRHGSVSLVPCTIIASVLHQLYCWRVSPNNVISLLTYCCWHLYAYLKNIYLHQIFHWLPWPVRNYDSPLFLRPLYVSSSLYYLWNITICRACLNTDYTEKQPNWYRRFTGIRYILMVYSKWKSFSLIAYHKFLNDNLWSEYIWGATGTRKVVDGYGYPKPARSWGYPRVLFNILWNTY